MCFIEYNVINVHCAPKYECFQSFVRTIWHNILTEKLPFLLVNVFNFLFFFEKEFASV